MADELSAADRSSLNAERGPVNMSVGAALVFEGGPGLTYDRVIERLHGRLHLLPRYRQRLEEPSLGLVNPVWVDDTDFDPRRHLRRASLAPDGSLEELSHLMADEFSRTLDRSQPLWEMLLVDGLADGRVALAPRMHHALVDGVAAVDVGTVLLDPSLEPLDIEAPPEGWQPRAYDRKRHFARLAATPIVRAQRWALDGASRALDTSPRSAVGDLRRATDLLTELARTRPSAPDTPLNRTISRNRSYAMASAGLADLKRAGKDAGGTINDALLAIVAGMLSRYLDTAAVSLGGRDPVALVPVSVRRDDEHGEGGNRISTVLVDLPAAEPDPRARIAAIAARMGELKNSAAVEAGALLVGATGWAPPLVSSMLVRALGGVRAFNLVVSNVPGPQQPFYLNGSKLEAIYPVVPLNPPNQGLSIGILSYDGGVYFGMLADRDLEPGLEVAADALRESLDEVLAL